MNKELIKGTTALMVLRLLNREPMYGYGLIKQLEIVSSGSFQFKEGTLYPILHQLEKDGFIDSFWEQAEGRNRKYYKITERGRGALAEKTKEWEIFSGAMGRLMNV